MKCPVDGNDLVQQTYEAGIEVDKCPACGGIWLDEQELQRIEDSTENDYQDEIGKLPDLAGQAYAMAFARSKPPVNCPRCDREMERREHGSCSQVMIDICPSCRGVWLDQGEIELLEIFFERAQVDTKEIRTGFFSRLTDFFG